MSAVQLSNADHSKVVVESIPPLDDMTPIWGNIDFPNGEYSSFGQGGEAVPGLGDPAAISLEENGDPELVPFPREIQIEFKGSAKGKDHQIISNRDERGNPRGVQ